MAPALARELAGMEARVSGRGRESFGAVGKEHDDLVMACALACWRARWRGKGVWGERSLGLG